MSEVLGRHWARRLLHAEPGQPRRWGCPERIAFYGASTCGLWGVREWERGYEKGMMPDLAHHVVAWQTRGQAHLRAARKSERELDNRSFPRRPLACLPCVCLSYWINAQICGRTCFGQVCSATNRPPLSLLWLLSCSRLRVRALLAHLQSRPHEHGHTSHSVPGSCYLTRAAPNWQLACHPKCACLARQMPDTMAFSIYFTTSPARFLCPSLPFS